MKNELYECTWLIGSSGGIGNSIETLLGEYSKKICLCDIKTKATERSEKNKKFWQIDCSIEEELQEFAEEATQKFGNPELMIVAAGYVSNLSLSETSEAELDKIYLSNFKIVALALKSFFKFCSKEKRIHKNIIIINSNAAHEPRPRQPIYAAMKSAINSLVQSQAVNWGHYNIKLNMISPGTVAVPRNTKSLKNKFKQFPIDESRPLGRLAFPADLHNACRFLFEKKLLMTGQSLIIDGGSNLK